MWWTNGKRLTYEHMYPLSRQTNIWPFCVHLFQKINQMDIEIMDQPLAQVPTITWCGYSRISVPHEENMDSRSSYVVKFIGNYLFFFQHTMTDATILLEDVQKMKDKGEIAQAYIGLKETNRYKFSFFILWLVGVCCDTLCIYCVQSVPSMYV